MMWRRAALKGAWPPPIFPAPQAPPEPHTSRPRGRGRPRDRGPLWQPWPTCAGPTLRIDPGAPRSGSGPERRGFGLGWATRRRVRSWSTCLTSTRATGGRFCLFAGAFCPGHCTMPQMWALDCLARAGPPARHPAAFQARQPCRLGHRWGTAGSTSPRLLSLPDHARTTGPLCGPTSQTACRCLQAAGPVARDHRRNRPWPRLAPGRRARHQIRRHQTAPGLPSPRGRRNEGQVVRRGRLAAARRFEHGMSGKTRGGEGVPDVGQINSRVASIFRAGLGPGPRTPGQGPGPLGCLPPRARSGATWAHRRPAHPLREPPQPAAWNVFAQKIGRRECGPAVARGGPLAPPPATCATHPPGLLQASPTSSSHPPAGPEGPPGHGQAAENKMWDYLLTSLQELRAREAPCNPKLLNPCGAKPLACPAPRPPGHGRLQSPGLHEHPWPERAAPRPRPPCSSNRNMRPNASPRPRPDSERRLSS